MFQLIVYTISQPFEIYSLEKETVENLITEYFIINKYLVINNLRNISAILKILLTKHKTHKKY
jgi:hypothetical protein